MDFRNRQHRTAVAIAWGIVTAATAVDIPTDVASSGVSMLPIPNPTTAAVAPEISATTKMRISNNGVVGDLEPAIDDGEAFAEVVL